MCGICGCGQTETLHPHGNEPGHRPAQNSVHGHPHPHSHSPHPAHDTGSAPEGLETRTVAVEAELLAHNDAQARHLREHFAASRVLALNLVSSPGAGKTTVLERTLSDLRHEMPFSVIEGDQQTDNDARRITHTGAPVIQITTGQACHLDADMVHRALHELPSLTQGAVLMIENVGNLVCPSLFDLGERCKVVVASITEGEDKPEKYPYMFRAARLVLLNKIDLLPHVRFDVSRFQELAWRVNPELEILSLSAATGAGMAAWYDWLRGERHAGLGGVRETPAPE